MNIITRICFIVCRAEGLKSSVRKSDDGVNQSVPSQAAQYCGTVPGRKGDGSLKPLGPLGLALRDDKDTLSKPRSLQAGGSDASYSSDEIQVIRYALYDVLDNRQALSYFAVVNLRTTFFYHAVALVESNSGLVALTWV